jgi:hypothetical protein
MESGPEADKPHRGFGCGKIIRADSYGHVEVSSTPLSDPSRLIVEWHVIGGSIPSDQRDLVIAAAQRILDAAALRSRLRCGVRLIIEGGSHHDSVLFAHAEAVESAVIDALKNGKFYRKAQ